MKNLISFSLLIAGLSLFGNCFLLPKSDNETDPSVFALLALANSGGGGGVSNAEATYTIGGTVTGLNSTVVLTNGGADLSISANGSYSFDTAISSGTSYNVTVKTQPANQTCTVANGTGTINANVTNINVTCNNSSITRNWGTFTDNNDGTVSLAVTAGTFGGQTYTAETLTWMKCSHGQIYDADGNTCSASGTATLVQYCNANDESCNDAGTGILNGTGTSGAYTACHDLNAGGGTYGRTNWRVPTKNELRLLIECTDATILPNDLASCGGAPNPSINNLFPNTVGSLYWSSTTYAPDTIGAVLVNFNAGNVSYINKTASNYVRCVSGP